MTLFSGTLSQLTVVAFLLAKCQAVHLELNKLYSGLKFVPLDEETESSLTADESFFFLERTAIQNDSYTQKVWLFPAKAGMVYYQDSSSHKVYYDFVTPHAPFLFYMNTESQAGLADSCAFKEFVNNSETFDMTIWGFAEIAAYFRWFDFTDGSEARYVDNGIMPEFYTFEPGKEVAVSYSSTFTDFTNDFWMRAKKAVAISSIPLPKYWAYPGLYNSIVESVINQAHAALDALLSRSGDKKALGQKVDQIKKSLQPVFAKVAEASLGVESDQDPLEDQKLGLQQAFSRDTLKFFSEELAEFNEALGGEVSLLATLFYFARHKAKFDYITRHPDSAISIADSRLSNPNFSRATFVETVMSLNFELLLTVFARTNESWVKNDFAELLTDLNDELTTLVVVQLDQFAESNAALRAGSAKSVLAGLNIERTLSDYLLKAHPIFLTYYSKFRAQLKPLIEQFFDSNAPLIESFRKRESSKFDGSGQSGFTSTFYRLSFRLDDPDYNFETEELESIQSVFTTARRLII